MPEPTFAAAALAFCRRRSRLLAIGLSALLAGIYLLWQPQPLDLSAQTFRADLWESDGFVVWNPDWYGGHTIPGYSVTFPPLGAWFGPALVGALSAVAATALFASIALRAYGERAWLGVIWFGLASAVAPYGGRTTFALGLAVGLLCVWAVQRRRVVPAALAGFAAALSSPVAALFTAIACAGAILASRSPSVWIGRASLPLRPPLAGAIGAGLGLLVLGHLFPTDGYQPFAFNSWLWIPLAVFALLALTGSDEPVLRWAAVVYLAVATLALAAHTPLGSNVIRLGLTFAGPLLAIVLVGRRPWLLAVLALPLLWWQWTATVRDVAAAEGDPSTEAAYYEPLLQELTARTGGDPVRVEVPPTRSRWEATYVAESFPLARGWLRQLESEDLPLFDAETLGADDYRTWLAEHGVSYVAVSDADPDYFARSEFALLERGVPGLDEVWSDGHWRLLKVESERPDPLVDGDARLIAVEPDRIVVELREPEVSIAFDQADWLGVGSTGGCSAAPDPALGDHWTRIEAPGASAAQPVEVELEVGADPECRAAG